MRRLIYQFRILFPAVLAIVLPAQIRAQDVKVICSGTFANAYRRLAPQYEKSSGVHLDITFGGSFGTSPNSIPSRLARGEAADVVIMGRSEMDELVKKGLVVEGSPVDLARSRIGIAVKAGAPVPDISTVDAFRKALLQAQSVAYESTLGGQYVGTQLFKRLGIEKEMAAKSHLVQGESAGHAVAAGEVEIGFQPLSELQPLPGITIVGPIPEEVQLIQPFSAGMVTKAPNPAAARALIRYLSSPEACATIKETALEPVACAQEKAALAVHAVTLSSGVTWPYNMN